MTITNQMHAMTARFQSAVGLYQSGQLQEAVAILKGMPDHPDALYLSGIILHLQGQCDLAITALTSAIQLQANVPAYYSQLGIIYAQLNRGEDAYNCFRQIVVLLPDDAFAHNNLGNSLKELSRLDEAKTAFENALRLKPDYALAYNNLGNIYLAQDKPELAAQSFKNALTITPGFTDAHNNFGIALEKMGELDEAVAAYLALLNNGVADVRTYNNLGNAYMAQGKPNDAIKIFQNALLLDSGCAETYCNVGYALIVIGKLSEAHEQLSRAIQLNPELPIAYLNLSGARCGLGKYEEAITCLRKAMEIKPDNPDIYSNLLFVSQFLHTLAPVDLFAEHLQFAHHFEKPVRSTWQKHGNARDQAKRIKIAYVSADFRAHAVATFIEPILANHDKEQVEVFCYYNHLQHDAVTDRIEGLSDHWRPCLGWSDELLAARIRDDGIDILIDLSGHTGGSRLLTFARKPSPVQITYLGYPGTTGLSSMDYRITDGHADTTESEQFYSETLLRLPDSLCCYRPVPGMPEVSILPALKNGYVTFGSFNNSNKIDLRTIHLWAQVMAAIPSSRLVMVTIPEGARRDLILSQFESEGVTRERIDFYGALPATQFHRLFQQVDIALDPLLITGGTTTCESMWMGVPVIVLVGQRFLHRVGYSFLCSAGLPQYGANTSEEYINIAVAAAADLQGLALLRANMREQLIASPLMDQKKFVRNFEKTLRNVWVDWCSSVSK
jgi:protein O-GlcNAc transferase